MASSTGITRHNVPLLEVGGPGLSQNFPILGWPQIAAYASVSGVFHFWERHPDTHPISPRMIFNVTRNAW